MHARLGPVFLVGVWLATSSVSQIPSGRRSVWDGIYTENQAKRGRESYEYSCATCHLASLDGDPGRDVPGLTGDDFIRRWSTQTVKDLFDMIKTSMPADGVGSLRPETYIDIVAYLLKANQFPSGDQDLTVDAASLEQIGIDKTRPLKR